jgi:hypothetical protein
MFCFFDGGFRGEWVCISGNKMGWEAEDAAEVVKMGCAGAGRGR